MCLWGSHQRITYSTQSSITPCPSYQNRHKYTHTHIHTKQHNHIPSDQHRVGYLYLSRNVALIKQYTVYQTRVTRAQLHRNGGGAADWHAQGAGAGEKPQGRVAVHGSGRRGHCASVLHHNSKVRNLLLENWLQNDQHRLSNCVFFRPMDLQKMEEKLNDGDYQTFTDFRNDFKLIVNNCRLYNGQNNGMNEAY